MDKESVIIFPFHRVEKGSKIILYGAGDVGQAFYWELMHTGYAEVVGWLDRSWQGMRGLDYPKIQFEDLAELEYEYIVIAINSIEVVSQICDELQKMGISKDKLIYEDNNVLHYPLLNYKKLYESNEKQNETQSVEIRENVKKIKIGFIGAGYIAKTIARTIQKRITNIELYAVAAREKDRAEKFAKQYGFQCYYGSYEEMLKDKNVEMVYISTPLNLHYEHTMMALEHGKHVICEKPIAVNSTQLTKMIEKAKEKQVFFADAMWMSYLPIMKEIAQLKNEEMLGDIKGVILGATYPTPPNGRLMKYELCGGGWMDIGCYLANLLIWLLGTDVKTVKAICKKAENGVDLQESILFEYDTATAIVHCGIQSVSDRHGYIYCENGYVEIEDANEPKIIRIYDRNRELLREITRESGFEFQFQAFSNAINSGCLETKERSHEVMLEHLKFMEMVKEKINLKFEADKEGEL